MFEGSWLLVKEGSQECLESCMSCMRGNPSGTKAGCPTSDHPIKSGCPRSRFWDLGKLNSHPAKPKACTELVEVAIRWMRSFADYFINAANLISVHFPTCQEGARFVPHKAPPPPPLPYLFLAEILAD